MTRLAAFYYSDIPGEVGPVRSMRASDIGIVSPGRRLDGDQRRRQRDARPDAATPASTTTPRARPGFFRDDSRSAPYNLFTDMGAVAKNAAHTEDPSRRLPAVGHRGRPAEGPAGDPASRRRSRAVTRPAGSSATAATSTRTPTPPTATSSPPTPCSCCGCRSATRATPTPPATRCRRRSSRAAATRCSSTTAGWSAAPGRRRSLDSAITLSTKAGDLKVPAGRVWIELVPKDAGDVTFGK